MAAGDEPDSTEVLGLAASVLARKEVVLAMQVLAGGDHALDRAIVLAGTVVRRCRADDGDAASAAQTEGQGPAALDARPGRAKP